MKLGVPKERAAGERRVAATPDSVKRLQKLGFTVMVEKGAGVEASYPDSAFEAAGAEVVDAATAWHADVVAKINAPTEDEVPLLSQGSALISLISPDQNSELVSLLATREATVLALDKVPRITRAQKMDVLSSMANIAGYRAIIEAATHYGGFFGAQMTAAGKTPPVKVMIIGAGVAGLAAMGAARSMGAIVRAFDVRAACKEQVESMGCEFLTVELEESGEGEGGYAKTMSPEFIEAEMQLFLSQIEDGVRIIVTTALIPGRTAPILVEQRHLDAMAPGSVVVDLAGSAGGNCVGTVPGEVTVTDRGVTIVGYTDLTSRLPTVASQFFATNIFHLLDEAGGAEFNLDHDNEALRGCMVLEKGESRWPPPKFEKPKPKAPPPPPTEEVTAQQPAKAKKKGHGAPASDGTGQTPALVIAAVVLAACGWFAPTAFIEQVSIFALSCFIGWQVIWNVNHALHTPLMSVTNAISGIIIVGGMIQAGSGELDLAGILGALAILLAAINVAGGFLVTQRMLAMFRRG